MIITLEWLESGMYNGVGIKRSQCDILGLKYPLVSGWKETLVGKDVSEEQANLYLFLGRTSRKGLKKQKKCKSQIKQGKTTLQNAECTNTSFNPNISFDDMELVKTV